MAQTTRPKISVIVASYNNEQTIEDCLKSILNLDYPSGFVEVIVMDGQSKDQTVQLAQKFPVKVVSVQLNAPAAYNYAMKITSHPILGFIDSDAKVEKDWLQKLVPHLAEEKVVGVSGSIETWNTGNSWARIIGYEIKNRYGRIKKYAGRIATMNLLVKKSVIEEVGGWDENLPSQYDTDMGFRLSLKGYKFKYEPTAVCYHFNRPAVKAYYRQQLQYGKNTIKLYFKHAQLALGDEITDFGMNIQPELLLLVLGLFVLGFVPVARLLWLVSGLILAGMLVYFVYSAAKIAAKFKDNTALRLVVLYYVRLGAWFIGAATTSLKFVLGKGGR